MSWKAVVEKTSGRLVSTGTEVDVESLSKDLEVVDLAGQPDGRATEWDESTRRFVARAERRAELESALEPIAARISAWRTLEAEAKAAGDNGVATACANRAQALYAEAKALAAKLAGAR